MKKTLSLIFFLNCTSVLIYSQIGKSVEFPSKDGLIITADLYIFNDNLNTPLILLFHQAGWSRGEYIETAPELNKLGFNCIAVDLRSGGEINGIINETFKRAASRGSKTSYLDAEQDMLSAIDYAIKNFAKGSLIIFGSSFSASLVLKIAGDFPEIADGVIAFSPGEYFNKSGKSDTFIRESAENIVIPVFITSAKNEKERWQPIYEAIKSKTKYYYLPDTGGNHGSRALWSKFSDSKNYWDALKNFLQKFNNPED